MIDRAPEIYRNALHKKLSNYSEDELRAFLDGVEAARSAGVYARGFFGSDVLRGIEDFQSKVKRTRYVRL